MTFVYGMAKQMLSLIQGLTGKTPMALVPMMKGDANGLGGAGFCGHMGQQLGARRTLRENGRVMAKTELGGIGRSALCPGADAAARVAASLEERFS